MLKRIKVELIPAIKRLEVITKSMIGKGKFLGSYRSGFKGQGLEFADYRVYTPGDDAMLIDWKATLRSDKTLIKEYMEERNLEIFILLDVSDSMIFGSLPKLKHEYGAEVAASLAHAILEAGDSVGVGLFNDKIVHKVIPGVGKHQFYLISKLLVNPKNYGGRFDFDGVADFLLSFLTKNTILIIISDFIGLNNNWVKRLELLSSKFKVVGIMVRDPRDKTLPVMEGQLVIVEDPYTGKQMTLDSDLLRYAYEEEVKKQEREIEKTFKENLCGFINLITNKSFAEPIIEFFRSREKRAW